MMSFKPGFKAVQTGPCKKCDRSAAITEEQECHRCFSSPLLMDVKEDLGKRFDVLKIDLPLALQ